MKVEIKSLSLVDQKIVMECTIELLPEWKGFEEFEKGNNYGNDLGWITEAARKKIVDQWVEQHSAELVQAIKADDIVKGASEQIMKKFLSDRY